MMSKWVYIVIFLIFLIYLQTTSSNCDARCVGNNCQSGLTADLSCFANCTDLQCSAGCQGVNCTATYEIRQRCHSSKAGCSCQCQDCVPKSYKEKIASTRAMFADWHGAAPAGEVGFGSKIMCNGIKCNAACDGDFCKAHCIGMSCKAWCNGLMCAKTTSTWIQ